MRTMMLPILGLAAAFAFVGAPAIAQETCAQKAEKIQAALTGLNETSEEKQKLAGQLAQGLEKCNAGANNPWLGVDPRINK
jgi:hypothetical protein